MRSVAPPVGAHTWLKTHAEISRSYQIFENWAVLSSDDKETIDKTSWCIESAFNATLELFRDSICVSGSVLVLVLVLVLVSVLVLE